MTALITLKTTVKERLNPSQKTFSSLKKKIGTLQSKLKKVHQELDEYMLFYQTQIHPGREALKQTIKELIKLLYSHYKKPKAYTKKEKEILKEVILGKIAAIFDPTAFNNADPEICAIIEDLEGISYDEIAANVQAHLKEQMKEMFENRGMDVDLSSVDLTEDEPEIFRKVFEAMHEASLNQDEELPKKPKTKNQLEKERAEQEFAELQKKGLSGIYKQLAKVLHPDLEQNPQKKAEKEQLMKRLTCAYENNDLHEILLLEMECMNKADNLQAARSDDQFKIYNSILKKQVNSLQNSIETAFLDPKYCHIQRYFEEDDVPVSFLLNLDSLKLKNQLDAHKGAVRDLQGGNANKVIQELLSQFSY